MLSMREWLARRREQRVARLIIQSVRYDDHRASEQLAKMGKEMVPHLVNYFLQETITLRAKLKMMKAELAECEERCKVAMCAFCGDIVPRNAEAILEHVTHCAYHPYQKLQHIQGEDQICEAAKRMIAP